MPVFPLFSPLLASSLPRLSSDTRDVRGALELGPAVDCVLAAQFRGQDGVHDDSFGLWVVGCGLGMGWDVKR